MITNKVNTMPFGAQTVTPMPRKRKTEAHIPNATTIRAIMDVEAGKVHYAKDLDDLFAQLEI